jgi:hypothetical protein
MDEAGGTDARFVLVKCATPGCDSRTKMPRDQYEALMRSGRKSVLPICPGCIRKRSRSPLKIDTEVCPNCHARLGADGTCHKCWWRPPRVELPRDWRKIALAVVVGVGFAILACLWLTGFFGGLINKPR